MMFLPHYRLGPNSAERLPSVLETGHCTFLQQEVLHVVALNVMQTIVDEEKRDGVLDIA